MDFLVRDVLHDFFHVRRAHRKRAVAALPMEVRQAAPFRLDPFRRTGLHFLHDFCQCEVLRQSKQRMNVVAHASDFQRRGVLAIENRR
jgi:hypothetical protein